MSENQNSFPMCLTAKDAMRLTGWSRSMVYRLLHVPECGSFNVGKRLFFNRDQLIEWIAKQGRNQEQDPGLIK